MYDWTKSPMIVFRYYGKTETCEEILQAYKWIADKLRKKDPNDYGLLLPRWVWFRYNGIEGKDLIDEIISEKGSIPEDSMLCCFDLNNNKVLLSDHTDWHCPLNNFYCSTEEEWDNNGELKFTPTEEDKIKSWDRIFDIKNKFYIQGIVWKLFFKDLIEVRFFRGKK